MKRLMKAFSDSSAMWRGWGGIGLPRVYVGACAGSRSVGRPRKRWTEVWMSGKQGEWCRIGVNAWGEARGMNPLP